MLRKIGIAALLALAFVGVARAYVEYQSTGVEKMQGTVHAVLNGAGLSVPLQTMGTPNQINVSCGATSTTLLAASAANAFIRVVVPSAAANSVFFNWSGAAAVVAAPSDEIKAGNVIFWQVFGGFLPTSAITCIALAPTVVTVVYK